jgi:hypothetical protein
MENVNIKENIIRNKIPYCAYDPDHAHPADSPCDNCGIWLCTSCGWLVFDEKYCNDCYKRLVDYGQRSQH